MADTEGSSSDESLDVTSDKFNPLKALYSPKLSLKHSKAPLYDNVSKFESILSGMSGKTKNKNVTSDVVQGESSRRRFLPHQALDEGVVFAKPWNFAINVGVVSERESSQPRSISICINISSRNSSMIQRWRFREPVASRKYGRSWIPEGRNVLTKMQNAMGPLGLLYEYMENRTRVKVHTRNASGIRGHVEAYVAAFDKHWNLALEDCFEVWTRKVKRKAPALGGPSATTANDESATKVVVTKIEGKRETLERHVPQMLLRGEHVAIIVKTN